MAGLSVGGWRGGERVEGGRLDVLGGDGWVAAKKGGGGGGGGGWWSRRASNGMYV